MRQFLTTFTTAILLLAGFSDKQEAVQTVLTKVKNNYDKHSSIIYKINYKQKFFDGGDTLQWNGTCKLVRDTTDTIFGGHICFRTYDSIERYYDLTNIYLIDHSKKQITEFKAHENQTGVITGNTAGSIIKTNFIYTDKLLSDFKDTTAKTSLLSDNNHFIVTIKYANEEPFSEKERNVWIRKNDFVIEKITYKVKFQGNYQYNEWNLSDIEFDNVKIDELDKSIKNLSQSYKVEQYLTLNENDFAPLKNGIAAPVFSGTDFKEGKEISSTDYKGKFIILDFSYMSCMPCIKAIPHLIQIQEEYGNKNVVVLAINSKDGNEKSKKRLPAFIDKNLINYPVILTSYKTDSAYNVKVYPTLYTIDKRGKVIFSQLGYSDRLADTLKNLINRELK